MASLGGTHPPHPAPLSGRDTQGCPRPPQTCKATCTTRSNEVSNQTAHALGSLVISSARDPRRPPDSSAQRRAGKEDAESREFCSFGLQAPIPELHSHCTFAGRCHPGPRQKRDRRALTLLKATSSLSLVLFASQTPPLPPAPESLMTAPISRHVRAPLASLAPHRVPPAPAASTPAKSCQSPGSPHSRTTPVPGASRHGDGTRAPSAPSSLG